MWSQLKMMLVAGERVNTVLTWLPSTEMSLGEWRNKYPEGKVLSMDTGVSRDYHGRAYAEYFESPKNMFPVGQIREEFAVKDWVVGLKIDGQTKAYPIPLLRSAADRLIVDTFADTELQITLGNTRGNFEVRNTRTNKIIPHVKLYWFAWQAFYPDTPGIHACTVTSA